MDVLGKLRSQRRRLSFTREGRIFVAVTLGVGFAALNTSNNLLFLMLAMMLSIIIVSGVLSEIAIRNIQVRRRLPRRARATEIFPVELLFTNAKRWWSSYSVELRDQIDGAKFRRSCYFLRTVPGETRGIAYRCELAKRGSVNFEGTYVSTRFPFGLFEKTRFIPYAQTLLCWPGLLEMNIPEVYPLRAEGGHQTRNRGEGSEFWQLREFTSDDDPRRISWKASARAGELIVRETHDEITRRAEVVLDLGATGPLAGEGDKPEEVAIRVAATAIEQLRLRGYQVCLREGESVLWSSNAGDAGALMDHLARLKDPVATVGGGAPGALFVGAGAAAPPGAYPLPLPEISPLPPLSLKRGREEKKLDARGGGTV